LKGQVSLLVEQPVEWGEELSAWIKQELIATPRKPKIELRKVSISVRWKGEVVRKNMSGE